jgi:hypothetical protein
MLRTAATLRKEGFSDEDIARNLGLHDSKFVHFLTMISPGSGRS